MFPSKQRWLRATRIYLIAIVLGAVGFAAVAWIGAV